MDDDKLIYLQHKFENVKRVFKAVEDAPGSLIDNIESNFLLPLPLAQWVTKLSFDDVSNTWYNFILIVSFSSNSWLWYYNFFQEWYMHSVL